MFCFNSSYCNAHLSKNTILIVCDDAQSTLAFDKIIKILFFSVFSFFPWSAIIFSLSLISYPTKIKHEFREKHRNQSHWRVFVLDKSRFPLKVVTLLSRMGRHGM
jgi:hypothetical protein